MTGNSGKMIIPNGKDTILQKMHQLFGEVGEWKDKLRKKNPGWNDVLGKVQKCRVQLSKRFSF